MKNRKIIFTMAVLLAAASMLTISANGTQERALQGSRFSAEQAVLTGELSDTGTEVLLNTEDGTYSLSTRGGNLIDVEPYLSSDVTLSGYLTSEEDCQYDGHMFVTIAQSGNQRIELDRFTRQQDLARSSYGRTDSSARVRAPYSPAGKNGNNSRPSSGGSYRYSDHGRSSQSFGMMNRSGVQQPGRGGSI
jgi:hypothetical protein